MSHEIIEKIMKKAISFEKYGMNDLAWNKEDAKVLIDSIMKDNVGILGGDVYKITLSRVQPLYDNWSCEPIHKESQEEYYLRSKIESLKYIENYPVYPGENVVFSITFTDEY